MLLNIGIFMWYGAVAPWGKFLTNDVIPLYRLVPLAVLVLIFRRLPWVYAIHRKIPQIEHARQAVFVGFFGPIGVSAIFYLYITLEFLKTLGDSNGKHRPDGKQHPLPSPAQVFIPFLFHFTSISTAVVPRYKSPRMA